MKHLKIEYTAESGNVTVLFDGEVNEVVWTDSAGGVRVEGKTGPVGGGMGGLLDLLTGASKAKTEAVIEEKRAEAQAEPVPFDVPVPQPQPQPQVIDADPIEVIQAAQT